MGQVINTNILSLNAQRNLDKSQSALGTTLQRLSSGLRINSAKDDAAGLAISNRMTAQIRGSNQAARNAADAISLAQTGEGGLQEITNNLQRMRELAIQSRNATNTASDRASLNSEFQQLLQEVDRVAQTTSFNGRNVLDGSLGTSIFQVGANVGETVAVNVSSSMRTNAIGQFASVTYQLTNELDDADGEDIEVEAGDISINGTATVIAAPDNNNGLSNGSAESIVAAINDISSTTNVTATATGPSVTINSSTISARAVSDDATNDDTLTYTLAINGTTAFTEANAETATPATATDLQGAINAVSNTTGVTATVDSATGALILNTTDGRNIDIQETFAGFNDAAADTLTTYFGNALTGTTATLHDIHKGSITLSSSTQFTVNTTDIVADNPESAQLFSTAGAPTDAGNAVTVQAAALNASSVLTEAQSDLAVQRIDAALTDVDNLRGTFGAIQSRFESTIANLQTTAENVSAARSRIRDADFASETAALTRSQILQQAGVSVLTQANAQPQLALALLQ